MRRFLETMGLSAAGFARWATAMKRILWRSLVLRTGAWFAAGLRTSAAVILNVGDSLRGSFCAASSISLAVSCHSENLGARGEAKAIRTACREGSILPALLNTTARLLACE